MKMKKVLRQALSMMLSLLMLISVLLPSLVSAAEGTEEGSSPTPLAPYMTELKIYRNGEEVPAGTSVSHGDALKVELSYVIPGSVYEQQKHYSYQLPVSLKVAAGVSGDILQGEQVVGRFEVSETELVRFRFNEDYNEANDTIANTFEIQGTAEYTPSASEDEKKFLYGQESQILVVTNPGDFTVEKTARRESMDPPLGRDSRIHYRAEIKSRLGTNEPVSIEDVLTVVNPQSENGPLFESVMLNEGSFAVTDQDGRAVAFRAEVASDGRSFRISELPQMEKNSSYLLAYDVDVRLSEAGNENLKGSVDNRVSVTSDGTKTDTTSTIYRSPVRKWSAGYSAENGVRWELVVNLNGAKNPAGMKILDLAEGEITKYETPQLVDDEYEEGESHRQYYNLPTEGYLKIDGTSLTYTLPEGVDYGAYTRWKMTVYTKVDFAEQERVRTVTNRMKVLTPQDEELWEISAEGIGRNTIAELDKQFLGFEEEGDGLTLKWSLDAAYSGLQNLKPEGDRYVVEIADRVNSAYHYAGWGWSNVPTAKDHYAVAAELDSDLKNETTGLQITANGRTMSYREAVDAGYEITFYYYDTVQYDHNSTFYEIEAADSTRRVKDFWIRIASPDPLEVTAVRIGSYRTHFSKEHIGQAEKWKFRNTAQTLGVTDQEEPEYTVSGGGLKKLVRAGAPKHEDHGTEIQSTQYWTETTPENSPVISYEINGHQVEYLVLAEVPEQQDSMTITDTIPEGLSIDPKEIRTGANYHASVIVGPYNGSSVELDSVDGIGWSWAERQANVKIECPDNQVKVTLTNLGSELKLYENRLVGIRLIMEIADLRTLEGSRVESLGANVILSRRFTNTVDNGEVTASADVTVQQKEEVLVKTGEQKLDRRGNRQPVVHYEVAINPDALDLLEGSEALTLRDTIRSEEFGIALKRDSIRLYEISSGGKEKPVEISSIQIGEVVTGEDGTYRQSFELEIADETAYRLEYDYEVNASGEHDVDRGILYNQVELLGVVSSGQQSEVEGVNASAASDHGSLKLYKVDADNNLEYLRAGFTLERYDREEDRFVTVLENFDVSGKKGKLFDYYGENLLSGNVLYRIVETSAPDGYWQIEEPVLYFIIKGTIEEARRNLSLLQLSTDEEAREAAYGSVTSLPDRSGESRTAIDDLVIELLELGKESRFYVSNEKLPEEPSVTPTPARKPTPTPDSPTPTPAKPPTADSPTPTPENPPTTDSPTPTPENPPSTESPTPTLTETPPDVEITVTPGEHNNPGPTPGPDQPPTPTNPSVTPSVSRTPDQPGKRTTQTVKEVVTPKEKTVLDRINTGDTLLWLFYAAAMVVSGCGIVFLIRRKKK